MAGKSDLVKGALDLTAKLLGEGGEQAAKTGIRAYHGSPHDFDKFDISKIGTGEGAQAYGHGLYLAEQEGVAKDYRKNLAYKNLRDKFLEELPQDADFSEIEDLMSQGYFSPDQTRFLTELKNNDWLGFDYPSQAISAASRGKISNYDPSPELEEAANKLGHMYEVNIAADPNAFLDWDKPLGDQSEAVKKFFPSVEEAKILDAELDKLSSEVLANPNNKEIEAAWEAAYRNPKYRMARVVLNQENPKLSGKFASGQQIYNAIAANPREASSLLREAGIPGIRYLDAGSRVPSAMAKKELAEWQAQLPIAEKELADAVARGDSWLVARKQDEVQRVKNGIAAASKEAEGTRNYVVFDDRLISIIRKYGIAGASAMLGYNLMETLDANQAQAAIGADKEYKSTQPENKGGMLPAGMEPSGEMTSRTPSASDRIYDYVMSVLGGDEGTKAQRAQTVMNVIDQTPLAVGPMAYDAARGITEKLAYAQGGTVRKGYATDGSVQPGPVFMEDAKGNKYDMAGNLIPPTDNTINDAVTVARREIDPYLKVPGHEHLKAVPPVTTPRPEYVPGEAISAATQPSRDVFWQGVEQFRNPQTAPRTPERAWELLSGAGQIGLGALGTASSGVIGAGVEALPTWLTGNQNQRNRLASELNEMTAFIDPALSPTAPIQRVGGIRNAAIVEGDLAKQRMLERGPSKLYDPLRVSSGVDPTEAGKAVANLKDAAIAKVGQTAEGTALKAAQEAVGGDDVAAATRAAQIEALNPVPPPQGITPPSSEHVLGTKRGERTVISPTSIKLTPAEQAIVNGFKSRADRALVASRIRETKARYPKSDGWAPFEAVDASFDNKGNPVIKWKEQRYGFNTAKLPGFNTEIDPITGKKVKVPAIKDTTLEVGTPQYKSAVNKATRNGVNAVEDVIKRAASGDEAALKIIRQAGWYREFMRKGFDERGGSYPAFSDLLGATSPNTAVDQNYRYSVDIQNRFARGDFDRPVKFASEYTGSLNEFPKEQLIYRDPVGPKGPRKLQYGMNSRNAQLALADKWREKKPGQAPKARNFSGNLGGATDEATIDVWAARFLNRMAGRKRLPPAVESGVSGDLDENLIPNNEFGFGQDVFRRITDELNRKGNLLPYLQQLGYDRLTPMDMQALTWFIEKEHWTKNNWTTAAGEGGSFEDELLKYPSERWQSGVSIEQNEAPSDAAMAYTRNVFENSLRDDPNVNQYRVHPTIGRYDGYNERSFDLELTAKPGWNPRTWMAAVIREAQANNQKDVFFSKRLSPEAAQGNPNARPGVEIYFRDRKTLDDAMPILNEFTKRNADGFTFVTDLRLRERELGGKQAPDFVGIRMQWVPEIRSRFDEDFRNAVAADPGVLDAEKIIALNSMQDALDALDKAGLGVVDARVHHYDTLTIGKESYDKFLEGIENPDNAIGNYEGSSGAAVDPVKRFGQPIYSHVEGRNRALRAGNEGGQPDAGGAVAGAGQPSGALTPEERAANFQSAFGQTYLKDPSGKPMRLYHLTPGNFSEFSISPENRSGPVVFLSPYKDFQPAYHQAAERGPNGELTRTFKEGANVMPVYADVRNPLVLDSNEKIKEAQAKYQGGDRGFPYTVTPEAKAAMEADGYDAIIFGGNNPYPYRTETSTERWKPRLGFQENREEEFIIFDPRKIKSATSNRGTYDTSDPDITKALGGSVEDDDIYNALRIARLQ